jgi:hypothetical protein
MSLNLIFKNNSTNDLIEFPYQTSTNLTLEVLNTDDKLSQFSLIRSDLESHYDLNDIDEKELLDWKLEEISAELFDDNISLTMI